MDLRCEFPSSDAGDEPDALGRRHDTRATGGRRQGHRWQDRLLRRVDRLHRIGGKQLCGTTFGVQGALGRNVHLFEDDLQTPERKLFNQLGTLANLEHDQMEDHERERERESCVFSAQARANPSFTCLRCNGASATGPAKQAICEDEKEREGSDHTRRVDEAGCHPRGTLNIPGWLGETELVLAVSESRCCQ